MRDQVSSPLSSVFNIQKSPLYPPLPLSPPPHAIKSPFEQINISRNDSECPKSNVLTNSTAGCECSIDMSINTIPATILEYKLQLFLISLFILSPVINIFLIRKLKFQNSLQTRLLGINKKYIPIPNKCISVKSLFSIDYHQHQNTLQNLPDLEVRLDLY